MKLSELNKRFLKNELAKLKDSDNPQARSIEYEQFLQHLFLASGLPCKKNIRSSYEEQIDLVIRLGNNLFLVEAKWYQKPVGLQIIQAFQWRLRHRGNLASGIIFSMGGFTKPAMQEAERSQESTLLLFNEEDITAILEEDIVVEYLIKEKLWYIQESKILFWEDIIKERIELLSPRMVDDTNFYLEDPNDLEEILVNKYSDIRSIAPIIFTTFDLSPEPYTQIDLLSCYPMIPNYNLLIKYYTYLFGFSKTEAFGIHQTTTDWYGFGIVKFNNSTYNPFKRYNECDTTNFHHSEGAILVDPFPSQLGCFGVGWFNRVYFDSDYKPVPSQRFDFGDFFLHSRRNLTSEIKQRIQKLCELAGFDYQIQDVEHCPEIYSLIEHKIKINTDELIFQNRMLFDKEKIFVTGATFNNPLDNIPKELKEGILTICPELINQKQWIGFFRGSLESLEEKEVFLDRLLILPIEIAGLKYFIIRVLLYYE